MRHVLWMVVASGWLVAGAAAQTNDFGNIVREFSVRRHKLLNEVSQQRGLPVPEGVEEFFKAAEAGDWLTVSNRFGKLAVRGPAGGTIPELRNELWAPVHETLGLYEVWVDWGKDSSLIELFSKPVLTSMPKGSIYFGGTDWGRFVITAANAVQQPPPVHCLTQNALADGTYAAHLQVVFANEIWVPQQNDVQRAFQQFVQEAQRDRSSDVEIVDGRVTVSGVGSVMKINAILSQFIFERNKEKHPFFVEESYPIEWMNPYLEPHGWVMKLNKEPLAELPAASIQRDTEFWNSRVAELKRHPGFAKSPATRKAFSKLRAAIGGIYAYRKQYALAEAAFRQALDLDPTSPEGAHRLAAVYEEQGEIAKAIAALKAHMAANPTDPHREEQKFLARLDAQQPLSADEKAVVEKLISQLGAAEGSVRAEANRKLIAMGPRVVRQLKSHLETKDPEIRLTLQEMVRELEAKIAAD